MVKNNDKKVQFMIEKDNIVKALYNTDLENFLDKIYLLNDFKESKIKCMYCDTIINKNTLYAIIPIEHRFEFSCNNSDCMTFFLKQKKKENDNG